MVSVIIPVRNAAATLNEQLAALASQTYSGPWEVVVSDNGSTDGTRACALGWETKLPTLRVVNASGRKGIGHARNVGISSARGSLILICDGDDIVAPDWVERMVSALAEHSLVTGRLEVEQLNDPAQYSWSGESEASDVERGYSFLPYPAGGNLGMRREVFDVLAGWDETLHRVEDEDFGWRAAYAGLAVHYAGAAVIHRRLHSGRSLVRARFREGVMEPLLYRRHRHRGMPPSTDAVEEWRWLLRQLPRALRRPSARHRWTAHAATRLGRVVGSARHRTLFL